MALHIDQPSSSAVSRPSRPPAPFAFHCVICFECFDHDCRYPVVLPCGHTYVCHVCSKRLKRCMECRQSLFLPSSNNNNNANGVARSAGSTGTDRGGGGGNNRGRGGRGRGGWAMDHGGIYQHNTHQHYNRGDNSTSGGGGGAGSDNHSSEPVALPLPKNLLLLTLMEAAEREADAAAQAAAASRKKKSDGGNQHREGDAFRDGETSSIDDGGGGSNGGSGGGRNKSWTSIESSGVCDDGRDDEQGGEEGEEGGHDTEMGVWNAIDLTNGTCGTYAVVEPKGLDIVVVASSTSSSPHIHHSIRAKHTPGRTEGKAATTTTRRRSSFEDEGTATTDAELENWGQDYHHSSEGGAVSASASSPSASSSTSSSSSSESRVNRGDTVQIVDFTHGRATLARGRGYMVASQSQLVKVGPPKDKACQIEGVLLALSRKQDGLSRIQLKMREDLMRALSDEPERTIVPASPPPLKFDKKQAGCVSSSRSGGGGEPKTPIDCTGSPDSTATAATAASSTAGQPVPVSPQSPPSIGPRGGARLEEGLFPHNAAPSSPAMSPQRTPGRGGDGGSPGLLVNGSGARRQAPPQQQNEMHFSCGGESMFSLWDAEEDTAEATSSEYQGGGFHNSSGSGLSISPSLSSSVSHRHRSSASVGEIDSYEIEIGLDGTEDGSTTLLSQSSSHDGGGGDANSASGANGQCGVNFRTGLSGHRSLFSSTARNKKSSYSSSERNLGRYAVRLMSEHKGIARVGRVRSGTSRSPRGPSTPLT